MPEYEFKSVSGGTITVAEPDAFPKFRTSKVSRYPDGDCKEGNFEGFYEQGKTPVAVIRKGVTVRPDPSVISTFPRFSGFFAEATNPAAHKPNGRFTAVGYKALMYETPL